MALQVFLLLFCGKESDLRSTVPSQPYQAVGHHDFRSGDNRIRPDRNSTTNERLSMISLTKGMQQHGAAMALNLQGATV
jgi:hypothetical protein